MPRTQFPVYENDPLDLPQSIDMADYEKTRNRLGVSPCSGFRLRGPGWAAFCREEFLKNRNWRIVYQWDAARREVTIVAVGPHQPGEARDVYRKAAAALRLTELQDVERFGQRQPCCDLKRDRARRPNLRRKGRA